VGSGTGVIGIEDRRGEKLVKDMGRIGDDGPEKGGVRLGLMLVNSGCRPAAGKTPPGGFVEDRLEAQPISSRGQARPGWKSIGEARVEESGAHAEHGTLRQTVVSKRPEGK